MAKYESQIKQVPYSQSAVYSKVSDLTHLAAIKERINDPKVQEQIPADKLEEVKKSLEQMECTTDTLSTPAGPIGNISVKIIEREPEKCVKFASTNAPVSFKLWIQILPTSETTSKTLSSSSVSRSIDWSMVMWAMEPSTSYLAR